jgi:hypothetical protein
MEKKVITNEPKEIINNQERLINDDDNNIDTLNNNKVGVDIDPNVKSNKVNLQICSCSIIFNCFSTNKPDIES